MKRLDPKHDGLEPHWNASGSRSQTYFRCGHCPPDLRRAGGRSAGPLRFAVEIRSQPATSRRRGGPVGSSTGSRRRFRLRRGHQRDSAGWGVLRGAGDQSACAAIAGHGAWRLRTATTRHLPALRVKWWLWRTRCRGRAPGCGSGARHGPIHHWNVAREKPQVVDCDASRPQAGRSVRRGGGAFPSSKTLTEPWCRRMRS
jgi:hypothetical protein